MAYFKVNKKQEIEGYELRTMTGDIVSFTPSYSEPLPEPFSNLHVKCEINATGGNGTLDNPNPINGYTAVNLTACGVNLFDKTATDTTKGYKENYYIQGLDGQEAYSASYSISEYIPFKSGIAFCISNVSGHNPGVVYYDNEKNYISSEAYSGNNNFTSTTPTNTAFIRFSISKARIDTTQLEIGNQASSYHAYTGNAYAIALGDTYYGGTLDVTTGVLTVTYINFTTDFTDTTDIGGGFRRKAISLVYDAVYPIVNPQLCNLDIPNRASYSGQFSHFYCNSDTLIVILPEDTPTSTEIEVVYELATPFDIDLTPVQIEALLGVNNVWHDANGDTEVTCLI